MQYMGLSINLEGESLEKGDYHSMSNLELGKWIESRREKSAQSLRQFARELGIAYQSLWLYEKGMKRVPERIWVTVNSP